MRYFQGFLREDGRDFRRRWRRLRLWHTAAVEQDRSLRHLARLLADLLRSQSPDALLATPGYVSYLASTAPSYDAEQLLSPRQVEVWEDLLVRLRTFELFQNLRRLVVRVRRVDGALVCPGAEAERLGAAAREIESVAHAAPARLHEPLGGRSRRQSQRPALRPGALHAPRLPASRCPCRAPGVGVSRLPPAAAPARSHRAGPPPLPREVPRRRQLLQRPRLRSAPGRRSAHAARLSRRAAARVPIRRRHADRAQPRPLSPAATGRHPRVRARATRSSARAWSSSSAWSRASRIRISTKWRRAWSRAATEPTTCGSSSRRCSKGTRWGRKRRRFALGSRAPGSSSTTASSLPTRSSTISTGAAAGDRCGASWARTPASS